DSLWYLFFEIMEERSKLGSIGVATSPDADRWSYRKVVLREPFHLSYPQVFRESADFYMVPETAEADSVFLYRARRFPDEWEPVARLLDGRPYADPTLFAHGGKWWMFTSTPHNDKLRLHMADALTGPWTEHPSSPIVKANPHIARPAGRVVEADGRLLRFAQDCDPFYGRQVNAFEITRLDAASYEESPVSETPILAPSGSGSNQGQIHHIDAHCGAPGGGIGSVDGKGVAVRSARNLSSPPALRCARGREWRCGRRDRRRRYPEAGGSPGSFHRRAS